MIFIFVEEYDDNSWNYDDYVNYDEYMNGVKTRILLDGFNPRILDLKDIMYLATDNEFWTVLSDYHTNLLMDNGFVVPSFVSQDIMIELYKVIYDPSIEKDEIKEKIKDWIEIQPDHLKDEFIDFLRQLQSSFV